MELTNEEKIDRINAWQEAGFVHPLTCPVSSTHGNLLPVVININVYLQCEKCGYIQNVIPEFVIKFSARDIEDQKNKLRKKGFIL